MELIRVSKIEPTNSREKYHLKITFTDGLCGVLDFSSLLTGKVFSALKELTLFNTASVQYGTIVWDGDIDIAPEYLYEEVKNQT